MKKSVEQLESEIIEDLLTESSMLSDKILFHQQDLYYAGDHEGVEVCEELLKEQREIRRDLIIKLGEVYKEEFNLDQNDD